MLVVISQIVKADRHEDCQDSGVMEPVVAAIVEVSFYAQFMEIVEIVKSLSRFLMRS